ncbi:MAG: tRNA lysidine(34) synthetase TilS [Gammaproteobacteria bacterium]
MPPDSESIRQALLQALPRDGALCVAFSGGRDSTILMHALAGLRLQAGFRLRALHVNHGLQPLALHWEAHCMDVARRLAVPCGLLRVVTREGGSGLEAAARDARYAALKEALRPGEWLLTAHHADDQLETVLMHLLRGSGVSGLAGIPRDAPFGAGHLCRPLLGVPGEALATYARSELEPGGSTWLTDPMNADQAYDRGFIRHSLTPVLRRRFPAAAGAAARSAALAAEAAGLLADLARGDAAAVLTGERLRLESLRQLDPARQRNLVRYLARERGWAVPPERRLREGLGQLLDAGPGKQPIMHWGGHEIRRFRGCLYLLDAAVPAAADGASPALPWSGAPLPLGSVRGALALEPGAGAGLAPAVLADGLEVAFRSGGERVRAGADRHHRTLKFLFQSRAVVPWMRCHVPLVFAGGRLAAVADLWTADWAAAGPDQVGQAVVWSGHAPIQ